MNQVPGSAAIARRQLLRHRALGATSLVIFVLLVQMAYERAIAPAYGYLGFRFRDPDPQRYAVVLILVLCLTWAMPYRLDRPSVSVLWFHFMVATVPSMIIPQFTPIVGESEAFRFALGVGAMWGAVIFLSSGVVTPRRSSVRERPSGASGDESRAGSWLLGLALLSVAVDVFLVIALGSRPQLVALTQVLDVRLGYRDALAVAPAGTAYLLLATSNVINPALMAMGVTYRLAIPLLIGIAGQIHVYSMTGYKTVILSVPVVLVIAFWLRGGKPASAARIPQAILAIVVISWAWLVVAGNSVLVFLFVLRFIVAPGNLAAAYVSIFKDREELYWSHSFMSWAIDYPLAKQPNFLVGSLFRESDITSANVNLFGDGYISMRWPGVALECLVLVALLWALDWAAEGVSIAGSISVTVIPTVALANSSVFTALTTHGFLVAVVILGFWPRATDDDAVGRHSDRADSYHEEDGG